MQISAKNLGLTVAEHHIFGEVTLDCPAESLTALIGPSGSGKTTLLHCLGMLLRPSCGNIWMNDEMTTEWSEHKRRQFWQRNAAFVLQDYGIIEDESVYFNVTMESKKFFQRRAKLDSRAEEILEHVGLGGRTTELAAHLSGGEKQRLAIARAMYKKAQAIFVDEPTASLDENNRQLVIDLLRARATDGATVIIATHDEEMIGACDTHYRVDLAQTNKEEPHATAE